MTESCSPAQRSTGAVTKYTAATALYTVYNIVILILYLLNSFLSSEKALEVKKKTGKSRTCVTGVTHAALHVSI